MQHLTTECHNLSYVRRCTTECILTTSRGSHRTSVSKWSLVLFFSQRLLITPFEKQRKLQVRVSSLILVVLVFCRGCVWHTFTRQVRSTYPVFWQPNNPHCTPRCATQLPTSAANLPCLPLLSLVVGPCVRSWRFFVRRLHHTTYMLRARTKFDTTPPATLL